MLGLGDADAAADADRPAEPEASGQLGGLVGEDVAEHVGGDDDVEAVRAADQGGRGRVHDQLLQLDVGELLGDLADLAEEQPVGQLEHVGLVHGGDLAAAVAGQLECGLGHRGAGLGGDLADREGGVLVGHELRGTDEHVAVGIEPFGVLPDDDEIHRPAQHRQVGTRLARSDVGVQPEPGAQLTGRVDSPLGPWRVVVVGDRAQEHPVDLGHPGHHLLGQRAARMAQRSQADVVGFELQAQTEQAGRPRGGRRGWPR